MIEDAAEAPTEDGDLHHPVLGTSGPNLGHGRVEVGLGDLSRKFDLEDESWVGDKALIESLVQSGQDQLLKLSTHQGDFVAGQWAITKEQQNFYRDILKAGPMVMSWVEEGY